MSRRLHHATLALALALSCSFAQGAAAQAEGGGEGGGREGDARERALELFRQSAERYREGRFAEAAALLREARGLHSEPVLSYNLARALEGAGDLEGAVAAYRDYLEEAPDAADAPATRARIETLTRHLEELRSVEAERERLREERERARTAPPPPPPRGPDPAPWVVAGSGAAVVIAGAALGGLALARHGDAQRAFVHADAVAIDADASAYATAANVCFLVGGVAALAGAIWGTVDVVTIPSAGASVAIGPGTVAIEGTF